LWKLLDKLKVDKNNYLWLLSFERNILLSIKNDYKKSRNFFKLLKNCNSFIENVNLIHLFHFEMWMSFMGRWNFSWRIGFWRRYEIESAIWDTLGHFFGYIHNKMSQTQFLCPFQKSKDLKLEIEMACNHCTKFMV
jgi:hypothetical protein